ncbi:MAG: hypothetical protein L0271_28090 [Gemmatimonadetes bacterium]|nr:hypothetical protein [Gemmatimonadota bacterium]
MSDAPGRGRVYNEAEVALILRSATDLEAQPGAVRASGGLALPEIVAIAREAGIDARAVERAAAALERAPRRAVRRMLLGDGPRFSTDVSVAREISDDEAAAMLDIVREQTGVLGRTDDALGALEWRGKDQMGSTFVRIDRRGGSTRVTVGADRTETAVVTWVLVPIGSLIGVAIGSAALGFEPSLATAAVGVGGGLGAARLIWHRVAGRWRARVRAVLDRLTTGLPMRD